MSEDRSERAEVLAALADTTRRELLEVLAAHGTANATALSAELPISRQAVVKHLAVLERAGLVRGHRAGREVRFTVRTTPLTATAHWMDELARRWDQRMEAIRDLAERAEPGADPER